MPLWPSILKKVCFLLFYFILLLFLLQVAWALSAHIGVHVTYWDRNIVVLICVIEGGVEIYFRGIHDSLTAMMRFRMRDMQPGIGIPTFARVRLLPPRLRTRMGMKMRMGMELSPNAPEIRW